MEEKSRSYGAMFIIDPSREDSIDEVQGNIKKIITDNAGTVIEERSVGKKVLGTPMRKKKEGYYYEVVFNAPPSSVEKINRLCRIDTDILRTLIDIVKVK